jgi:hypothetical protein
MDAHQQVSCSASLVIVLTSDYVRITTFSKQIWPWCSHRDSCLIYLNGELENGNELVRSFPVLESDEYDVITNHSIGY